MFNILIVEDEKNVRNLIKKYLLKNNYNVFEGSNGSEALDILDVTHIDLIITDIMMPELDGYELIKELRDANFSIPILIITAKDTIQDKTIGFMAGADDYMVKPIDMSEMVLRVEAILRRANIANERKLILGNLIFNYDELSLKNGDINYELKPKEFYILYKLLSFPNRIFTRQDLMDEFWGIDSESDPRTVDVHIKRIREKTENIKEFEIVTIRGLGYKGVIK